MTWIIHKGDRTQIFNSAMSQSITIGDINGEHQEWALTIWFGATKVELEYPDEKESKQALGYLMEAIRRGDKMVSI